MSYFHTVPAVIQRTLAAILRSPRLVPFFETLRERLDASHRFATGQLSEHGIGFVAAQGGIVLWLDLRHDLSSASFEAEDALWTEIFKTCRVSISPGGAFHCAEPGWFRLCFTVPDAHLREGVRRLREYLGTQKSP